MKKFLILLSTLFLFHFINAQDCPGNLFANGDLELGTPTNTSNNIGIAPGYSGIWATGSRAEFYTANSGPGGTFAVPTPASGNFASFWVSNSTNQSFREGFRNHFGFIAPNTGTYTLSFDMYCLGAGGWGQAAPQLGVYAVSNPGNIFVPEPPGSHAPLNAGLYGAANTIHLADIMINTNQCNGMLTQQVINFDSSDPNFPANGITDIFLTHSDAVIAGAARYVAFDNFCLLQTLPAPCAFIHEHVECAPGGYNLTLGIENNSGLLVDGIDVVIPGLGFDPSVSIPQGGTYNPGTVFIPNTGDTEYCFEIIMFNDSLECCHITHCVDLPECDPCLDIELRVIELGDDGDDCCYSIDVGNNYDFDDSYFTGIVSTILTPGVNFDNPMGGNGWSVTPTTGNVLTWSPPGPFINQGISPGALNFCFTEIQQLSQMPQIVVFDWMTTDMNGQDSIACSDTISFQCEPCLMIELDDITCLDDGTYDYCFTITNNGDEAGTRLYFDPYSPAGATFDPNPIEVNLPAGATDSYCVNISGVSGGDIVEYRALLKNLDGGTLNWCCIVDTFAIEIPICTEGCQCDDGFDASVALGYNTLIPSFSCDVTFFPVGLEDCYNVSWSIGEVSLGTSMGNTPFNASFRGGSFQVCMNVTIPGTDCSSSFCDIVTCAVWPEDDDPDYKLANGDDTRMRVKNLYPNPANDLLNVEFSQEILSERLNLQVVNAMGEVVLERNNFSAKARVLQLDVSALSEGVYFLRLETGNKQSMYSKFVKLN